MTIHSAQLAKRPPPTSQSEAQSIFPEQERVAHVVCVSGSQAIAVLDRPRSERVRSGNERIEIGALMKICTPHSFVIGLVSAISCPVPEGGQNSQELELIELSLSGEILIPES